MSAKILKNGETITIRPIKLSDYGARHQFFVELSLAQTGMLHAVDEIDYHASESEEHIKYFLNNRLGLWLVAENQSAEIVGEIDIIPLKWRRVRHNAKLTMGVAPAWQGLGLGSILLEEALKWSQVNNLKRVELSVLASNLAAQGLYKKHGFVPEGVRRQFLAHDDGTFEDEICLALFI